jgi:hypothetical protein
MNKHCKVCMILFLTFVFSKIFVWIVYKKKKTKFKVALLGTMRCFE